MSDDLISRKSVIDILEPIRLNDCNTARRRHMATDIQERVNNLPIAYDIDTVCDELEKYLFEKYCIEGDEKIDDIVRNGGKIIEIDE